MASIPQTSYVLLSRILEVFHVIIQTESQHFSKPATFTLGSNSRPESINKNLKTEYQAEGPFLKPYSMPQTVAWTSWVTGAGQRPSVASTDCSTARVPTTSASGETYCMSTLQLLPF